MEAYVQDWLRRLGHALKRGGQPTVEVLDDGRARLTIGYPSLEAAMAVWKELEALKAMAAEDAMAENEDELFKVVRDYHNGDD